MKRYNSKKIPPSRFPGIIDTPPPRSTSMRHAVELTKQDGGWYFARIPDLPGCMSEGKTPEEAMKNIEEARKLWMDGAVESGYEFE